MWKNLEPNIVRQRLIIEGLTKAPLTSEVVRKYLLELSNVSGMKVLIEPVEHTNHPGGGLAMWIHWDSSGAHFYSYAYSPTGDYKKKLDYPLFTLDTYTCKPFSIEKVIEFTKEFLNPVEMAWKEVSV